MALSPEVYAAYKSALTGQQPLAQARGMKRPQAASVDQPLNLPPAYTPPAPEKPGFVQDLGNLAREGMDTSQANVQRALTHYGVGDFKEAEAANRKLAGEEFARVSPETQQAMQDLKYDDSGFHGVTPRALAGHAVKGLSNVPSLAGTVGGVLQAVPHPLAKAAGFALGAGSNALDIGGSAGYDVEQAGGDAAAQAQAINEGATLGAGTGLLGTHVIGKVLHGEGGLLKKAVTGAVGEGLQEYPEEAGQQVVENRALLRPTFEGAHEAGVLGATIGGITGGVFGGGASLAQTVNQKLQPVQDPNAANQTGTEIPTSSASVPFTRQGAAGVGNVDLSAPAQPAAQPVAAPVGRVNPLKRREDAAMSYITPNAVTPEAKQTNAAAVNTILSPEGTESLAPTVPVADPLAFITPKPLKKSVAPAPAEQINEHLQPTDIKEQNVQENKQAEVTPQRETPVEESAPSSIEDTPYIIPFPEGPVQQFEPAPFEGEIPQRPAPKFPLKRQAPRAPLLPETEPVKEFGALSESTIEKAQTELADEAPDKAGMQVRGIDSYHLEDPEGKKSVKKPAGNSSIARRAVSAMHLLTTGEEAEPEYQADGSFKIGDSVYKMEQSGNDYRVVPATGFDSQHDVTIEYNKGEYKTRVDNYGKEADETQKDFTARRIFKRGIDSANALANAEMFKDQDTSSNVVTFDMGEGQHTPVTISALRELGAAMNDRPNDSIEAIYENVKDGIAYAVAKFGPMKTSEANLLKKVVADAGGLTNTSGKDIAGEQLKKGISGPVTFREMMGIVNKEARGELAASRREKTFGRLSVFLNKRLFGKKNAPAAQVMATLSTSEDPIAQELVGELKNNPQLDWSAWLRDEQKKARTAAKNTEGGEIESRSSMKKTAKGVEYSDTEYNTGDREFQDAEHADKQPLDPSTEDSESFERDLEASQKPSVAPVERVIPQAAIVNYSRVSPKVEAFFNDLLKTLQIPQAFTLVDVTSTDKLPKDVMDIIAKSPDKSQFIAMDSRLTQNKTHYIYLAKGTPARQAVDLAHEFGHFVQRNVLDHVVAAVQLNEDKEASGILAGLLGVETKPGEDPMNTYNQLSPSDRDIIDEMFADRLAEALLREKNAFKTNEGVTFADVVASTTPEGFFQNLAKLLKTIYNKLAGAKGYTANFDDFMMAMTGRTKNMYSDIIAQGGRTAMIRGRDKNRTQYNAPNPLQVRSQIKKMTDTRLVQGAIKGFTHFYGTVAELHAMKSPVSSWLAREMASKTGDISRGSHGRDYFQLLHNYNGQLAGLYEHLLGVLPEHGKSVFGVKRNNTPQGDAFIMELHKHLTQEGPLSSIPTDLNFTVEETGDGRKNVTLNVRDVVEQLRAFDDALYAFETANGAPLQKKENHWAKVLGRETVLNHEAAIRAAFLRPISRLVWAKGEHGEDVQVLTEEEAWSVREVNNLIDRYRNGTGVDDMPFAGMIDPSEVEEGSQAMTGKVSLFNKIFGPTKHSAKARHISQVRWLELSPFTEADPMSVILQRAPQAAKTRAMDDKFGSWVVKGKGAGKNFSLMTRAEYKDYGKAQRNRARDSIVELMGYAGLTDAAINSAGEGGMSIKGLIEARNELIAVALAEDNLDPKAVEAKELWKRFNEAMKANYYDPVAKIEAALANGEDQGEISQQDVIRIKNVILPAMFGRLGQEEMSSSWRAVQSYIQTAMNVVFLPMAVLSSLAEPSQIGVRMYDPLLGESMWTAQGKMLTNIGALLQKGNGKSEEAQTILKQLGLIKDAAIEHALTGSIESEYIPMGVKKFNAKFFEVTLLKSWTDFVRRLAYTSGKDALRDYASKAMNGNPQAIAQAKALGLDIQAATTMDNDTWVQSENFQTAIYRWVEEATLRPGADTRPARMSDPRFGLLWYLKDFPWAMQARTISYVAQQSKLQPTVIAKMIPWIAASIPLMIAGAIGAYSKDLLTNQLPAAALGVQPNDTYKDSWKSVMGAIKKSGMLGIAEMPVQFMESYEHRGIPWIGTVSPVASVLQDVALRGAGKALSDKLPIRSVFSKPVRDAMWKYEQ